MLFIRDGHPQEGIEEEDLQHGCGQELLRRQRRLLRRFRPIRLVWRPEEVAREYCSP